MATKQKCYYELLMVDRSASSHQIRDAYKRLAKQLHPDKGSAEEEESNKQRFQQLLEAYQVLSNPSERAWYDAHRQQILHPQHYTQDFSGFDFNIEELLQGVFIAAARKSDEWTSFYKKVEEAFITVRKTEERVRVSEGLDLPSFAKGPLFGDASSSKETVDGFYNYWRGFQTCLSFSWADQFDVLQEKNRQIRKLAEKENRRFRGEARRDYLDKLAALLQLVRTNDPRVRAFEAEQKAKAEEAAQAEKAARQRQAEEWTILKSKLLEEEMRSYDHQGNSNVVEQMLARKEEGDFFDCLVCEKSFKTQNQLISHERSKDHKRRYKKLLEEVDLLDPARENLPKATQEEKQAERDCDSSKNTSLKTETNNNDQTEDEEPFGGKKGFIKKAQKKKKAKDEEREPETKHEKTCGELRELSNPSPADKEMVTVDLRADQRGEKTKTDKKERKKKKQEEKKNKEDRVCRLCSLELASKNKLFEHLKEIHNY